MISSTAQSKFAHRHAALQQIEYRLTFVLARMANLKVEQARMQAECLELIQRKEWITNPPPRPTINEAQRSKNNARQREYQAKRRAEGKPWTPRDREKYNAYHREYERKKRAKQRVEKLTEHRNDITTQIKEHHI